LPYLGRAQSSRVRTPAPFRRNKITLVTHRCHILHTIRWRDGESEYRWIGGCTQSRRSKKPPKMISPGASSSLATPLTGNCIYNATCLGRFRRIRGGHDYAAAPRDTPRCACTLSHALRFLDRNSSRAVVSLTCRGCPGRWPLTAAVSASSLPCIAGERSAERLQHFVPDQIARAASPCRRKRQPVHVGRRERNVSNTARGHS
jgi:hypothetical protein